MYNIYIKALKLLCRFTIWWLILSIIIRIINGLIPAFILWITGLQINEVYNIIVNNEEKYSKLLFLLTAQILIMIFQSLIQKISDIGDFKAEKELEYFLGIEVINKAIDIPYSSFEEPEFYNHYQRIRGQLGNKLLSPIKNILDIFETIIKSCSLIFLLWTIHYSLLILCVIAAIPILFIQLRYGNKRFNLMKNQTQSLRKSNYINTIICSKQSNKEVRIFNLSKHLINKWSKIVKKNNKQSINLAKQEKIVMMGLDALNAILYASAVWVLVILLKNSKLILSQFVVTGQAISGLQQSLNLIATYIARIHSQGLYVGDLISYLEYNSSSKTNDVSNVEPEVLSLNNYDLTFENVHFKYPKSNTDALKGISFKIREGESVAIIGDNGSGKTTIINCLLGLYSISEGEISIGGYPISKISPNNFSKLVSVLFQDYTKYAFTIKENITFGDITNSSNDNKVHKIGKLFGVWDFTKNMKDGYKTSLGKVFENGEELSGGQWQKIALSRVFYKDPKIVILDEPTSALDPYSEIRLFERLKNIKGNKTLIFISHRMSAVQWVDKIIVLEKGNIIEMGNHFELINNGGKYFKMFTEQSKAYDNDLESNVKSSEYQQPTSI